MSFSSPLAEAVVCDARLRGAAYLKYVSANDVGETKSHQCGFYLSKAAGRLFSPHASGKGMNTEFYVKVSWHGKGVTASCIKWYGEGTRDEYRLTGFGRGETVLKSADIGSLLVLVKTGAATLNGYVLHRLGDVVEALFRLETKIKRGGGLYEAEPVPPESEPPEPPEPKDDPMAARFAAFAGSLDYSKKKIPPTDTLSLVTQEAAKDCIPGFSAFTADEKLDLLLAKEFELYLLIQDSFYPKDTLMRYGDAEKIVQKLAQGRMSRAGRSLENHFGYLMKEAGIRFVAQAKIGDTKLDFLVPGVAEYNDPAYPDDQLVAVSSKRTARERWREVFGEARRLKKRHILTIDPRLKQLEQIRDGEMSLIVPARLVEEYSGTTGLEVFSVQRFLDMLRMMPGALLGT